ncbi:MAG: SPFH domain-containing protein [Phycisphaeraceae bacterium]
MTQSPTDPNPTPPPGAQEPGLDAAQQSLSDALRVSFGVLKVVMALLFVVYLGSGVFRVDEQNTAVRYRFGEQIGTYGSGWHFGLPFPIEEVVMVPRNAQTLRLHQSFWYDNPEDREPEDLAFETLDPLKDSFLITGDTNVVHVQFEVVYVIEEKDVEKYLKNVGSLERANELIRTAAERGMIHAIASAKTDDIVGNSNYPVDTIEANTQQVLTDLDAGITVQQVLIDLKNQSMPNQVREAYRAVTQAQAEKSKTIQDAQRTYDEQLTQAAGSAHPQLLTVINAYEAALGYGHDTLADRLRDEINRSIERLQLPGEDTLALMQRYMQLGSQAAVSDDASADKAFGDARQALSDQLGRPVEQRELGRPISGEIASRINQANTNRVAVSRRAQTAWEDYDKALQTYKKTPEVFVNSRLQQTRMAVFSNPLIQSYVGVIPKQWRSTLDPETIERINNAQFERRRQQAAEERAGE